MSVDGGILLLMSLLLISGNEAMQRGGRCVTPEGQEGTCISIAECPTLRAILTQVKAGILPVSILRRAICLLESQPFVCCAAPTTPINPPINTSSNPGISRPVTSSNPGISRPSTSSNPGISRPTTSSNPGISRPGGASLLPSDCGVQGLAGRIIAGHPAPLGAWPWMVILRGIIGGRSGWFCGGTLISDRYVITAAHCVTDKILDRLEFARIGEHTLRSNPDCNPHTRKCAPQPQDIRVEQIIMHPSYDRPCSTCNDIALLRLSRPVTLNRQYVMPICLPRNPQQDMGFTVQEFQQKQAWAAGWGTISRDPSQVVRPNVLQQVQLPIQNLPFCDLLKRNYPDHSMVMCAGGENRDTCRGDSGGPLTLTNNFGSKYFLVGITSKGPNVCGAQNTQGLYTSVHHYLDWIIRSLRP